MISVSGHGHVRASASPMPDVAPVIHTMFVVMTECKHLDILVRCQSHGRSRRRGDARLAAWIERTVGGTVTRIDRMPGGDRRGTSTSRSTVVLPLHARGEREPHIAMPARIADEVPVHDLLEAHGLPVPHAYGLCDDPDALVMDRLSGLVDLAGVTDDAERDHLLEEYLELLARIYAIPLDAAAAAGFAVPDRFRDDRARVPPADGRALRRSAPTVSRRPGRGVPAPLVGENVPQHRLAEARFITYDSFQFMFDDGRITGLLDFEHAHVGDPMMDLAAFRIRDTLKNLGDLAEIAARYEAVTGVAIDHDVVEYQTVLYNALSVVSVARRWPIRCRDRLDLVPRVVRQRRPLGVRVIAEIRGYTLDPVRSPTREPTRHAPAYRYLVESLRAAAGRLLDYELVGLGRLASHVKRVDEIGAHLTPPTSTTWPTCSGTVRIPATPTPSSSTTSHAAGPERRGGPRPPARRAGAAAAPHHGVAHVADAAPSRACAASAPSAQPRAARRELAHRRHPRHPLIGLRVPPHAPSRCARVLRFGVTGHSVGGCRCPCSGLVGWRSWRSDSSSGRSRCRG